MPVTFEDKLRQLAEIIVKVGVNVQPGQRLLIGFPVFTLLGVSIELAPLVRHVVRQAYQAGASLVDVLWDDQALVSTRLEYAPAGSFSEFSAWRAEAYVNAIRNEDAILMFGAYHPDQLAGEDPQVIQTIVETVAAHTSEGLALRSKGLSNGSVSTAPVDGWSAKVFPDLAEEEAHARFWEVLFEITRVNQPDPLAAWRLHLEQLDQRCLWLNGRGYQAMHLTAPGTDLFVGLPPGHLWTSCQRSRPDGVSFVTNIPTEEVFTIVHKDQTQGVVALTKPVCPGGIIIEGLKLHFEAGKVVEASADTGEEYVPILLDTDEGARFLGELALVPHSSLISQTGLTFFNILLDENTASHIALGSGIRFCLEGGAEMTDAEYAAAGGNDSKVHIDGMIGSEKMDVDGILADGTVEPVMRAGEFVI